MCYASRVPTSGRRETRNRYRRSHFDDIVAISILFCALAFLVILFVGACDPGGPLNAGF